MTGGWWLVGDQRRKLWRIRLAGGLNLIRIAQIVTLVGVGVTVLCVLALLTWQIATWAVAGYWPSLDLSTAMDLGNTGPAVYTTASTAGPRTEMSLVQQLYAASAMPLLLLGLTLLVGFYLWLCRFERNFSPAPFRNLNH